jgi:hypothetical protein
LLGIYVVGDVATFIYLVFFDDYRYTWWNWLIVVPINFFLAQIWPLYWLLLRPFFER